ncbi:hypothetical protein TrRE_jg11704, partial [Triparma retinervis]
WVCWDDVSNSEAFSVSTPTVTCTSFTDSPKCPQGQFSTSGFQPCEPCPSHLPHTLSPGSTSIESCISYSGNLVAVSQNGNKILSYSPGKESWDILTEEHEFMKAPRSIVWISATNFLVSSFFIDQVHEYRMDGTYVGLFCEVFEPEGIVLLPPPFNLVVVTSMDN